MFKTKSSKFIGLLAIAGLAVGSGAAFTASNTFSSAAPVAGYAAEAVTGATVTDTAITPLTSDPSQISAVTFTTSTDVTADTAVLTFSNTVASAEAVVAVYSCAITGTVSPFTITCDTAGGPTTATSSTFTADPTFAGIDQIGLTVTPTS
jgi:hypothetical protein